MKSLRKVLASLMTLVLLLGIIHVSASAAAEVPELTVELNPGLSTGANTSVSDEEGTLLRDVMISTSEITSSGETSFLKSASLTLGKEYPANVYTSVLHFSTNLVLSEEDELNVKISYGEKEGTLSTLETKLSKDQENYDLTGLEIDKTVTTRFVFEVSGTMSGNEVAMTDTLDVTLNVYDTFVAYDPEEHIPSSDMTLLEKNSEVLDVEKNKYEIELRVPAKDKENRHEEVILMVDGSYSLDEEWNDMKVAITTIGRSILNGSGHTQLTLMAFGMGDNIVLEHVKNVKELEDALGELPKSILYGRSSTNCEAGFTGVQKYIEKHDQTLKKAQVIYISDGRVNTDETPRRFYNWKYYATTFGALGTAQGGAESMLVYADTLPKAFYNVFKNRFADAANNEEILNRIFGGEATNKEFIALADQIWEDVYKYSGLYRGLEYPVSVVERAFVKYDKEHGTHIQEFFYYTTYKSKYVKYPNGTNRAIAAAERLCEMDIVTDLYVMDYDNYSSWMDTGITNSKAQFIQSEGIDGLVEALEETLQELSETEFNDVAVTDYMSKWVNLDPTSLRIVDNNSGEVVWTITDGWVREDVMLLSDEAPVTVELIDKDEYAAGGADVVGNENGDIYKLTWSVKEGSLLRSETYSLRYDVTMDVAETGFEYNHNYPLNGLTTLEYYGEGGEVVKEEIEVPQEEVKKEEIIQDSNEDLGSNVEDNDQGPMIPEKGVETGDGSMTSGFMMMNVLSLGVLAIFLNERRRKLN